jgi:Reverse transcriptase (RNA-dependent DNA polymerase)
VSQPELKRLNIKTVEHLYHRLGFGKDSIDHLLANKDHHYIPRPKETKPGKIRPIVQLSDLAKKVLKAINRLFQNELSHPVYVHGGIRKRNTKSNAEPHTGCECLVKLDIKDFFPSITPKLVRDALIKHTGVTPEVASLFTDLSTHEDKLITGSPSSTIIATIVIREATEELLKITKKLGAKLTVYVDDVSISGPSLIANSVNLFRATIEHSGVVIHPKKIRVINGNGKKKYVTGARVDNGLDVRKRYIEGIRRRIDKINQLHASGKKVDTKEIESLKGGIRHMSTLNKGAAKHYAKKLEKSCSLPPLFK